MIWILLFFIIINIVFLLLNIFIYIKEISNFIKNEKLKLNINLFSDELAHKIEFIINNSKSYLSLFVLIIINSFYYILINPILKIIQTICIRGLNYEKNIKGNDKNQEKDNYKLTNESEKKIDCFNINVEIFILLFFIIEIIFYFLNFKSTEIFLTQFNLESILIFLFSYRLITIFFKRSYEILRFEDPTSKYVSYPRTFIIFIINFVEIIIAFSFLYTNNYFKIEGFEERNLSTFFNTLNIFSVLNKYDINKLFLHQQLLILSQFLFYFIIITYFFNNLKGLKFKK